MNQHCFLYIDGLGEVWAKEKKADYIDFVISDKVIRATVRSGEFRFGSVNICSNTCPKTEQPREVAQRVSSK